MKNSIILAIVLFTLSHAQQIDLINGTLDNQSLCGLTIETATDILGRPSFTEKPNDIVADVIGPKIYYHDSGLALWFQPSSDGGNLSNINIYLVETWDEDRLKNFVPFLGQLVSEANPNWKIDDVVSYYKQYNPVVERADQRNEAIKASGIDFVTIKEHLVSFSNPSGHNVNFFHEEVTSFLERVSYNCYD
jgi:hypothetical protein